MDMFTSGEAYVVSQAKRPAMDSLAGYSRVVNFFVHFPYKPPVCASPRDPHPCPLSVPVASGPAFRCHVSGVVSREELVKTAIGALVMHRHLVQ